MSAPAIKSLAAFKRALAPGMVFHCENNVHPEVSGPRTVRRTHVKAMSYRLADGRLGWISWPKRGEYRIEDGALQFLTPDGAVAFTFRLAAFYGACGVEMCTDCRPLYSEDDEVIPGTES